MGDNNVGGNGSVVWSVNGHNVIGDPASNPRGAEPGKPRPFRQGGVDKTPPGSRFTIQIRLPRNPADPFLNDLRAAANNPVAGAVYFTLPIEDIGSGYDPPTPDQIQITWPSDPNPQAGMGARVRAARRPSGKLKRAKPGKKKGTKKRPGRK
jgi:hypothetical protein